MLEKLNHRNDDEPALDMDVPLGALTEDDMKEVLESLPGYHDYLRDLNSFDN